MYKISCVCVSKNNYKTVKNSINSFLKQTYSNKELVFLYEDNNLFIKNIKNTFNDTSIKYFEIKYNKNINLGFLRNKGIELSTGEYIMQWDDDDIYHPERIKIQYNYLYSKKCDAVILDQRYIHFENKYYLSNLWPFEGSILCKKSLIKGIYLNKKKAEDTHLLVSLLEKNVVLKKNTVQFLHCPSLYIYTYHGNNVFDRDHFNTIIKQSKIINKINTSDIFNINLPELNVSILNNNYTGLYKFLYSLTNRTQDEVTFPIKSKEIVILNTYNMDNPDDGLSIVFHIIKPLGKLVNDTSKLSGKIVIICGMCYMYINKLSLNNINIIYTTYEFYPLPSDWVYCLNKFYNIIVVPNKEVKDLFLKSGVKKPIYIIQQGIPERKFIKNTIDNTKFTIGFCGVPVKRKNLEKIIKSIEYIKNDIPNIVFKVHISKYYKELTKIVFPENKHFDVSYGYKTDQELSEWYSSLDCYIFPSDGEGWSYTPRESLSLNIPSIISNCLSHSDLIEFCETIYLPVTVDKISKSIINVYNNPGLHKKLAEKGSKHVDTYNKWRDTVKNFSNLLDNIKIKNI